jgi:hypothetical protein
MSLDNFHLTPFLVQHLYKKTLVDLDPLKPLPVATANSHFPFLGKNEKNILIVVDEKDTAFLPDDDLQLLVSILLACKLSLADIALINFDKNQQMVFETLMQDFTPSFVLLFGISPKSLSFPLHFPNYQLQQYNHQTYLSAPALKVLATEIVQKKELWSCLQKYFLKK